MSEKMNWLCEYVSNTAVCDICGKQESGLPQYICDAHTHGMNLYGHREFQVIIECGPQEICRLLNTMGMKVRDGEGFKPGDRIKDLYLDCEVELREKLDVDGVPLLRLVIPDKQNRWPEESADYPYNMQILSTIALYEFGKN